MKATVYDHVRYEEISNQKDASNMDNRYKHEDLY